MKLCQRVVATLHCQLSRREHFYPVFPDITHISSSVVPAPLLGLGKGTRSKLLSTKKGFETTDISALCQLTVRRSVGACPAASAGFLALGLLLPSPSSSLSESASRFTACPALLPNMDLQSKHTRLQGY